MGKYDSIVQLVELASDGGSVSEGGGVIALPGNVSKLKDQIRDAAAGPGSGEIGRAHV